MPITLPARGIRAVALSIALGAVVAGCSSGSTPAASTGSTPPSSTSTPAVGGATLQQGTGNQFVFTPTTLTVKHGTTIAVSNVSTSTPHTFTITGEGIDITNSGGQSQQVTIDLAPGTYQFFCRFHVSSGMKGSLVVT